MKGSQAKKLKDQRKEDHLAPTKIEDYHKPISAPARRENLSHKEAQDKADVYSRVMNKKDRFFRIQKLKGKHKFDADKLNDNRLKQDVNYKAREHSDLPQHLKDDRDWQDQNKRNQEVKKWKEEYDKDGLKKTYTSKHGKVGKSHAFNHVHNQYRNKGMDKDR
ncbi:MAG: hypothetical protein ABJF04_16250 [Reichenbachiella sp.]|uniref:hypothetical protein n=1 Tax=Reichenbachiella sp. TaxID=2184521 RepID=UPI003267C443